MFSKNTNIWNFDWCEFALMRNSRINLMLAYNNSTLNVLPSSTYSFIDNIVIIKYNKFPLLFLTTNKTILFIIIKHFILLTKNNFTVLNLIKFKYLIHGTPFFPPTFQILVGVNSFKLKCLTFNSRTTLLQIRWKLNYVTWSLYKF